MISTVLKRTSNKDVPKDVKHLENEPNIARKCNQNGSKIMQKWRQNRCRNRGRPKVWKISKKVHLGIFSRGHIFDQNRLKITSKNHPKINAWKVSKNDAKRSEKWAQMAPEIDEKSNPKSLLKKAWKNNKKYKIFEPSEPWKTLFSCRKTAILMKSTFSNECRKSMRKSSKKHAKMRPEIYINSFKNLHRKKNAKMTPTCSKMGARSGHKIDKMS